MTESKAPDRIAGVVVLTLATGASLGPQLLDGNQAVGLALPADTTRGDAPPPEERPAAVYELVVHPAYRPQQEPLRLPPDLIPEFRPVFGQELEAPRDDVRIPPTDDYRDPTAAIDPAFGGRWMAGFAPVGNSEMIVIVEESREQAMASDRSLLRQLAGWLGGTLLAGFGITLALISARRRALRRAAVDGPVAHRD